MYELAFARAAVTALVEPVESVLAWNAPGFEEVFERTAQFGFVNRAAPGVVDVEVPALVAVGVARVVGDFEQGGRGDLCHFAAF